MNELQVGEAVVFIDPRGQAHAALLTAVWGKCDPNNMPAVNLAFVSGDAARTDSYGRQIERYTSVPHRTRTEVHGLYWKLVNDPEVNRGVPVTA